MKPVEYGLGRGYASSARLNLVHYLWKETMGYLLHSTIPTVGDNLRVADIGTGTGIWLFDLADHLPSSARLDGFDISAEQYSPQEWIQANVSLRVWNALEEPGPEFQAQYDIVHMRLFMIIVENYDPRPLLENCKKLLKIGGYLILEEVDLSSSRIVKTSPSNPTLALQEEEILCTDHVGIKWVGRLPDILQELDFTDISVDRVNQLGWKTKMWQQQQLLVKEEFINNSSAFRHTPQETEMKKKKITDMWAEVQQGSVLGVCLQSVIARRASVPGGAAIGDQSQSL